ncbi:MAG: hypothetical protein ACNI3A_17530 [Desulfovibrio sp.]|uniref:hypothetical protein n=1 Tax=Desulfovibrio sp. 7SRBS1 TaxID=3378064 RepID=UPI003B3FA55B
MCRAAAGRLFRWARLERAIAYREVKSNRECEFFTGKALPVLAQDEPPSSGRTAVIGATIVFMVCGRRKQG